MGPCDNMEGPLQVKVGRPGDDRVAVQVNVMPNKPACRVGLAGEISTFETVTERNNTTHDITFFFDDINDYLTISCEYDV